VAGGRVACLAAAPEESLELLGLTKYKLVLTARATGKTRSLTLVWYRCAACQNPHVEPQMGSGNKSKSGRRRERNMQRSVSTT
jgi:hypothetical protein